MNGTILQLGHSAAFYCCKTQQHSHSYRRAGLLAAHNASSDTHPVLRKSLLDGLVHDGKGAAGRRRHRAGHLMPLMDFDIHISMLWQHALQVALCKVHRLTCKAHHEATLTLCGIYMCAGISYVPIDTQKPDTAACPRCYSALSQYSSGYLDTKGRLMVLDSRCKMESRGHCWTIADLASI